jgi:hypothetical protein
VLAYDRTGTVIVSDFQRFDAATNAVLAEDLRYSRRFDSFYFTEDSANVVTLAGSEWRVWNVASGEVVRREVVQLDGSRLATSSDGHRFLLQKSYGVEIVDLDTEERKGVDFERVRGTGIERVVFNPSWTKFLVIYGTNSYGQYYQGNEIALYDLEGGKRWFMAGDDLPASDYREYGWVDEDTVYIYGEGDPNNQIARVFGVDYDATGLPACAVAAYPDALPEWIDLWERLVNNLWPDELHRLSLLLCAELPDDPSAIAQFLLPTATPAFVTPTPIVVAGVPVCLTTKYPDEVERYSAAWRAMTAGLTAAEAAEVEALLCEGIGRVEYYDEGGPQGFERLTMFVDAETGVRSSGAFQPVEIVRRPLGPIAELFERVEGRPLGTAILSPDDQLLAVSGLPGELVIYTLPVPYRALTDQLTATAVTNLERANLVGVLPSPTPTFNLIGTANPTLTPTITPTPFPPPVATADLPRRDEQIDLCPAETLYSVANPPEGFAPAGQIVAEYQGSDLWTISPTSGQRRPDPTIPRCGLGLNCTYSPDKQWILVEQPEEIFVVRPDGSDSRQLFAKEPPNENTPANWPPPPYIIWSGGNTLEYEVTVEVEREGQRQRVTALQRDILGVFPDPTPWIPEVGVNQLPTQLVRRQPGGPLALVSTEFNTGVGIGTKYYVYDTETGESTYFARTDGHFVFSARWDPLGRYLYFEYYDERRDGKYVHPRITYVYDSVTDEFRALGVYYGDFASDDRRYAAFTTQRRTYPIGVWDRQTGLVRHYCLPETGARLYSGRFLWSPDRRYLALLAPLPKDETAPGIGQHVMILDIETGAVVDITTGANRLVSWLREPGTYGEGQ